jgi:MFS family permease
MTARLITPELRQNFHHLYADIFWFGILSGSTMAFLAIYAARLGASGLQIGLLTAGPAVMNLIFSLPAGRWMESHHLVRVSFWSALLYRAGYLALIPLPWLFISKWEIWTIVLITLVMSIPGTMLAISFNAMFADVVPPEWRSDVVGRRNALMSVSLSATALLCGQLLDRIIFPLNYQIVFGLGALGAAISTYHVGSIQFGDARPLRRIGRPLGDFARPGLQRFGDAIRLAVGLRFLTRSRGKSLLRFDLLRGPFGPFLAAYLLFYTFQFLPVSIFPLAYVHALNLTDGAISLGSALFYATMLMISLRLGHLSVQYGHKRLLVFSAIAYGIYPLLIGLARDATLFWLASLVGGLVWGIASAAAINRLMERVPEDARPAYMALHNLAMNIGILAGSLSGPLLVEQVGIPEALLIGAGLRMFAGLLLAVWG